LALSEAGDERLQVWLPLSVRHITGLLDKELGAGFPARFMVFPHFQYEVLPALAQRSDGEQVLEAAPGDGSRFYDAVGAQQNDRATEIRQRADQQKHSDYLRVGGSGFRFRVPDARGLKKRAFSRTFELGREHLDFLEGAFHRTSIGLYKDGSGGSISEMFIYMPPSILMEPLGIRPAVPGPSVSG
jgi:hypothetical protein